MRLARRLADDRSVPTLAAVASIVLGLALFALAAELRAGAAPPPATAAGAAARAHGGAVGPLTLDARLQPAWLSIPAIEVEAPGIVELGLDEQGAMEVPAGEDFDRPGWYVHGPRPGELGPAVIGGHVDSRRGASVFYRLGELEPGDQVEVGYADGTVARFRVTRVETYPKSAFPFNEVFGDTAGAELRLLTCGGVFDHGSRSYDRNVVAYAQLAGLGPVVPAVASSPDD